MSLEIEIKFTLNGRVVLVKVPPTMTALSMLREKFDLTGGKLACGEGECGACTVKIDDRTINSCLMFAVDCDGREIQTIEGLGKVGGLETMQQAFVDYGAVQCGYCMPGMIMQARYVVDQNSGSDHTLTRDDIARGLEGNVCRCSGYTKVVDAVAAVVLEEASL
ncbi:MAG: 2Fe-2S iron-sulfur cluster binding domain-containing protein [Gammaproteobacteria bacterium]|nr:2Fe-2S iron-sulfur cluster binding domain-containing protein [Gammaproteobacteria bacterium]